MGFAGNVRRAARGICLLLIIGGAPIGALLPLAGIALAQSGAVAGSTLDPQTPNESLIPLGGFQLDAPAATPANEEAPPWPSAGNAGFGLQLYGGFTAAPPDSAPAAIGPAAETPAPQP